MKITKNQLKELVQQSIEEMIEGGPGSGRKGGGDTTGGPSYANVPKGAKTSKDAKKMKKKKKSLGTSIASKFQKQIDKYNKARKQTPKGLKRVTKEGKLTEKVQYKKDKKIDGKWYTKQGTHKAQAKANILAKREFGRYYDTKVVKEKDGYTIYVKPLKESNGRKCTVKEIKQWMKKLEENRYRKVVNADARRVAWLVNNNLAEDYDEMPKSIRKKWSEAKYGRERYLANEFIKHLESKQLSENKLRTMIRNTIKEVVNGKKK